ncbi:MAG TPA: hypothetical protein VFE13_01890 [Caulobacteraceae bacterium]|nr:hypothetical protein [Caulobacteraceae bacterium]
MSGFQLLGRPSRLALIAATASLALAACNQNPAASNSVAANVADAPVPLAAIPLDSNAMGPAIAPAPTADSLPPAPPAAVGRVADPGQAYAFVDRAAAMNAGFGDSPPDYAVDGGGGQRPWVWQANDRSTRIAEALPGGGYRYYYYEPGASAPYLVRDAGYSYGYQNGTLVAIYGPDGRVMPGAYLPQRAGVAGRILARAASMLLAAQRERREAVAAANWAAKRDEIAREREEWVRARQAQAAWKTYHDANRERDEAYWAAERYRREAEAARFAQRVHDQQAEQRALEAARRAQEWARTHPQPTGPGYAGPGGPGGRGAIPGHPAPYPGQPGGPGSAGHGGPGGVGSMPGRPGPEPAGPGYAGPGGPGGRGAIPGHPAGPAPGAPPVGPGWNGPRRAASEAQQQQKAAHDQAAEAKKAADAAAQKARSAQAAVDAQQQADRRRAAAQAAAQAEAAKTAQQHAAQQKAAADAQAKRAAQAQAEGAGQSNAEATKAARAEAAAAKKAATEAARKKAQADAASNTATRASPRGQQ